MDQLTHYGMFFAKLLNKKTRQFDGNRLPRGVHMQINYPIVETQEKIQATQADATTLLFDLERQKYLYNRGFYRKFRKLRWLFRYDCRYRLYLMEELFRKNQIPFEHQKVFELGFGTGDLLFRFDGSCCIHGCEASCDAIQGIEQDHRLRRYRQHSFMECDPNGNVCFPSDNYDIVIASHVLEHVSEDLATLKQLAAHTKPHGLGLFFLPLERPGHLPTKHIRTYTTAGFQRKLKLTGWEPIDMEENFRYESHWVQVFDLLSRREVPILGILTESLKNITLSLAPTSMIRLSEKPLERLNVTPRQIMVLAQNRK